MGRPWLASVVIAGVVAITSVSANADNPPPADTAPAKTPPDKPAPDTTSVPDKAPDKAPDKGPDKPDSVPPAPDTPDGAVPVDTLPDEPLPDDATQDDREFGPLLLIERIDITGNTATKSELIRRTLPIAPGDALRASDRRLREARFKVLALGFFRDVTLAMHKGSARGQVTIEIHVIERGTVVLTHLWFGTTSLSPYWLGADVFERNLLGLGVGIGGGFIYAAHGDVKDSRSQWAGEVRAADPSVLGTRIGAFGALTIVHGSESYRIAGTSGDPSIDELDAFPYRRVGFRGGITYDLTALTRLSAGFRAEEIKTELPVAPTQMLSDNRFVAVDLHLDPGTSQVVTAGFALDRDTRPDPILPHTGGHIAFAAELGSPLLGSDYQFATLFGRYEHYWPLFQERHAIALKLAGGVVIGDAPRFDRLHVADLDRMLTPRALGLVLSSAAPINILGTRADKPAYGDLGGSATVEYAMRLWRGKGSNRVYGGDIFLGAGVWGLAETDDLRARSGSLFSALPLDLYIDAGLRVDTDIGIFEFTLANGLGRLR